MIHCELPTSADHKHVAMAVLRNRTDVKISQQFVCIIIEHITRRLVCNSATYGIVLR